LKAVLARQFQESLSTRRFAARQGFDLAFFEPAGEYEPYVDAVRDLVQGTFQSQFGV
jgi:hypothetical protein